MNCIIVSIFSVIHIDCCMKQSDSQPDCTVSEAIVLHANYHQFAPDRRLRNPLVHSRMLLWCIRGRGRVVVNSGDAIDMGPGKFVAMPWRHSIEYLPASDNPFYVGGIHVIPRLTPGQPIVYRVYHARNAVAESVPAEFAEHHDVCLPGLDDVFAGHLDDVPGLGHLAAFTLEWFVGMPRDEFHARALARMLLSLLSRAATSPPERRSHMPISLDRMLAYVREKMASPIRIDDLARVGTCSPATVTRLFRSYTGIPPMGWLMEARMKRSAHLLATTGLEVKEIGVHVGIDDPHYFSKLFRRYYGMTALQYRQRTALMP